MALILPQRSVSGVHYAEFTINFDDTMVDVNGVTKNFGSSDLAAVLDIINLPTNSRVIGGQIITRTAFDSAGLDIILGDSVDTDRYHATADLKAVGAVSLLVPGYKNTGGLPLRLTMACDDVCTAGQLFIWVSYVIEGSATRVQPY